MTEAKGIFGGICAQQHIAGIARKAGLGVMLRMIEQAANSSGTFSLKRTTLGLAQEGIFISNSSTAAATYQRQMIPKR